MQKRAWWKQPTAWILVAIGVIGILIILFAGIFEQQLGKWYFVPNHIGIAFLVAGILGLAIDITLRQKLAEDAFRASIGYILPNELKGEMEWIYNCPVICVEHIQKCELQAIDDETCFIRVNMQRKLRNVSGSKDKTKIRVEINEWFHKTGASKIISFGYSQGGEKWVASKGDIGKGEDATIRTIAKDISLAPSEEITFWHETEEVKRVNDEQSWVFLHPTLNPLVSIKAYDGIHISVGFGHRIPPEQLNIDTYRLPGTLLADQVITIHWWKGEDLDKWLAVNE